MHVRRSRSQASPAVARFDLWRVAGRKRLTLGDDGLDLQARAENQALWISLSDDLADGSPYVCTVPMGAALRGQLDALRLQEQALSGHAAETVRARAATRAALMHLRGLQALDGVDAGASHREIAQALFGHETTVLRWHADGELRAQVRHLLRRAESYRRGGYLGLLPQPRDPTTPSGDESMR